MEYIYNEFIISTEKEKLSLFRIKDLLKQSYWANDRSEEIIIKSIEHSECFGVYLNNIQVGFARVVTDYSTIFWIADVIIDTNYRGRGIGKELIRIITKLYDIPNIRGILATKDAQELYKKYGFINVDENLYMTKKS